MAKYRVTVEQTFSRHVIVEAEALDADAAIDHVRDLLRDAYADEIDGAEVQSLHLADEYVLSAEGS